MIPTKFIELLYSWIPDSVDLSNNCVYKNLNKKLFPSALSTLAPTTIAANGFLVFYRSATQLPPLDNQRRATA
jgi:hypothetical protein